MVEAIQGSDHDDPKTNQESNQTEELQGVMEEHPSYVKGSGGSRWGAVRPAAVGLAGFFALSVPVTVGHDHGASAGVTAASSPSTELSRLPPGWPEPVPQIDTDRASDVWNSVYRQCERFGIADQAVVMFQVMWEESRLRADVVSPSLKYEGIAQFAPETFYWNVRAMRRLGLISREVNYSPFHPEQAIEVMAWMWSKGYSNHWGPYSRVAERLERKSGSEQVN